MSLTTLSCAQAARGLRAKEFSAVELAEACLTAAKTRNPELNALITIDEEGARTAAREADKRLAEGSNDPLLGIPYTVKDAICTIDVRSTGAATILDDYTPPFDATVIGKIRAQGAVLLGKSNCDAFGHGASNENSMYGPVRNPFDVTKVAGGSSGGAGAALASGMGLFAIAEDTGGSIRQPASFCGVVGVRPSYGRNSRYGIMPMASSLDTVGPLARTVEDAALLLEVMAGRDERDATTVADAVPRYTEELKKGTQGLKVGIPREYLTIAELHPEVKKSFEAAQEKLRAAGCTLEEVAMPHTKYAVAVYYIVVPSEDSSNLARLDGIRYGSRREARTLYDTYAFSRAQGFPEEVKRRILIGTYALSAGYYDAYYKKAQAVRTLIKRDFDEAFTRVDALLTPTSPFPAFGVGEKSANPLDLYVADVMVSPAALAGVPAMSVPAGMSSTGLPIGMQVMGPRLREDLMLRVARALE